MKKLLLTTTLILVPFTVTAGEWTKQCRNVKQSYKETIPANGGDVLGGAIIGGILGKAITGNDDGAAVGAIIGGAIGNENNTKTVTRYKTVRKCNNVYVPETVDFRTVRRTRNNLSDGVKVPTDLIRDVQHTIGVKPDGVWGPASREAANQYIRENRPNNRHEPKVTMYSLIVNGEVVIRSDNFDTLVAIQNGLSRASVISNIRAN